MTKIKDRKQLIAAASELNQSFGLDPEIDITKDNAIIEAGIIEALGWATEDDEFTPETQAVLDILSGKSDKKEQPKKEEPVKKEKKAATAVVVKKESTPVSLEENEDTAPNKKVAKKVPAEKVKNQGKDHTTSNKAIVYTSWKNGEIDIQKLQDTVKGAVKLNTVKGWCNQWKTGKNLPAIAK